MARRLRIQFAGARYHVINRGNLQHDVFATGVRSRPLCGRCRPRSKRSVPGVPSGRMDHLAESTIGRL